MSSDDNFCICRSFSQLHTRLIIHLQLELDALDKKLNKLDAEDDANDDLQYRVRMVKDNDKLDPAQKNLFNQIAPKLNEYGRPSILIFLARCLITSRLDDLLLKFHAIKSISEPSKLNYNSVLKWIWDHRPVEE